MGFQLFATLDREWESLVTSATASAALRRWADDPILGTLLGLDDIVRRTSREAHRDGADALLAALVKRAPTDETATRALLQALSPGLNKVARRMGAARDPDIAPEVVAVALAKIRCYPWQRRPRSIAANLILDVLHELWATRRADGRVDERPVPPDDLGRLPFPEPTVAPRYPNGREVLEVVARRRQVPPEQLQLMSDSILDQVPLSMAARRAGISTKAMKSRRARARTSVVRAYQLAASA